MTVEWLLIGLLLVAATWLLLQKSPSLGRWMIVLLLLATSIGSGFALQKKRAHKHKSRHQLLSQIPIQQRDSYASSETCRSCHPQQYESWHQSYHRTMTQVASPENVRGDFNNVTLEYLGQRYHLQKRGDEFWVDMVDPDWTRTRSAHQFAFENGKRKDPPPPAPNPPRVQRRLTMMTGSHHMQAYWVSSKHTNTQLSVPFTYLFEDKRWAPRPEVFLRDPLMNPEPLIQVWNNNCIRCHSTAGQPQENTNRPGMRTLVAEFGISCEACHGPAEEHVRKNRQPGRRYALHKQAKGDPTIVHPARLSHIKTSEACGQCHSVNTTLTKEEWMRCGFTFVPGDDLEKDRVLIRRTKWAEDTRFPEEVRKDASLLDGYFWSDGMVRVSGREFNGLVETPCYQRGELSCLSCHSMHKSEPNDQLALGMDSNRACVQCHSKIGEKIEEHTHHRANSSGSSCYNCHMPHTTFGLLKAIRSHTVSSPNVSSQLLTGRPNACNLCHLDKSLAWTATNLTAWYKTPQTQLPREDRAYSSAALMALKGDAGQRALIAWHMGWKPAQEVSGTNWTATYLAQLLDDPYSAVRYVANRSLHSLPTHKDFAYDYLAPKTNRAAAHQRALQLLKSDSNPPPSVKIRPIEYRKALSQRNDRSMELLE